MFKWPGSLAALFLVAVAQAGQASPAPAGDPAEILRSWCDRLSKELRSVRYERCIGRSWQVEAQSPGGRPIPALVWGTSPRPEASVPEPRRILVMGAMHGDEISSVSAVFRWIDFLDRTKVDSFLRQNRYMFIPLVNPDGFYIQPRTRTNLAGVDLNRNFSTKEWSDKALPFWKIKASSDPRRYPGEKPGSETETRVVEKAINEFKPDLIISVHAPYCLVDHDGPISFPDMQSPLPVRTLGAFPGSLGTYAGIERNIPVVTPELPSAKQLPDLKALEQLLIFIMKAKF